MPSPGDSGIIGIQQLGGEGERIADADTQPQMQFAGERQPEEHDVRNAPSHATPIRADFLDGEVGEQVVEPLERGIDYKC